MIELTRRKGLAAALGFALLLGAGAGVSAKANPGLDGFYGQQLDWRSCAEPRLDAAGAQCAEVRVPLNYAEPQGKTITVAISRIAAPDPAQRRGVMLSNPGGPGGAGLDLMTYVSTAMTPEVRASYDLIGMDPRGVGRSTPVNCRWPRGFGLQAAGPDAASFAESVATQADLALRCAGNEPEKLRHLNTRNTARDMDVIRGALGVERISYIGSSYGTYLGAVFAQMFPERTDRMVLDGAVDPDRYGAVEMVRDMGPANEAALDRWAEWTAARDSEYHLGATGAQVRAGVQEILRRAAEKPIRIGTFEVDAHDLPLVLFAGLVAPNQYPELAGQLRQLTDAAAGTPVEPSRELATFLGFALTAQPRDHSENMTIMCNDKPAPRDPGFYWGNIEAARASQPIFGAFTNNITPCAFWAPPLEPPTRVSNSVPALIVQATGDTRTTYGNAEGMHRALSASRMVTLQDVAIHGIFGFYPNTCVDNAVNSYLRDGALPATDMSCRADQAFR